MKLKVLSYIFLYFVVVSCNKQLSESSSIQRLTRDVSVLADDSLGGRLTGTSYEAKSADYISEEFRKMRLTLKFDSLDGSNLQPFTFYTGFETLKSARIEFTKEGKREDIQDPTLLYPTAYSGNGAVSGKVIDVGYGLKSPDGKVNDFENITEKGAIYLVNLGWNPEIDPHVDWALYDSWRTRVQNLLDLKPKGVILYNSNDYLGQDNFKGFSAYSPYSFPILYFDLKKYEDEVYGSGRAGNNTLLYLLQSDNVSLASDFRIVKDTGYNVLGYLDNKKEKTIVIGAHYDHLGKGEFGHTLSNSTDIHNGADDNASGVALMLELARKLRRTKNLNYNFLFIGFSGEELGLLGSNYYVKHPIIDNKKVVAMLNFDMVGKLDSTLFINGTGTSPAWDIILNTLPSDPFKIKTSTSGQGPSDHTSFYNNDIPVLHFFTGAHSDYHKPEDDIEKINYKGIYQITDYVLEIIKKIPDENAMVFTPTKNTEQTRSRFKVTLGIMPDYAYEGFGLRVDGITQDKPAAKAGILKGDIIIQMSTEAIRDIYDYMNGLSKYREGDTIDVVVQRGDNTVKLKVTF
jgi:hypothetical protein